MKILKFNESDNNILKYYAFDFDDNILIMPTQIHLDKKEGNYWKPIDVSTEEYANVRGNTEDYRLRNNSSDQSFWEFRDFGPRGEEAFIEDIEKSIKGGNFGPSWDDFIECLTNGSLFAIITARGHEEITFRRGVEWIIDNYLSEDQLYKMYNELIKFSYLFEDERGQNHDRILKGQPSRNKLFKTYLDNCDFVGISCPSRPNAGSASSPEKDKEDALLEFKSKINKFAARVGLKAKVGFSDDDLKNVKRMEDLVDNIKKEMFPNISLYIVKGTKDPSNITKKVRFMESGNQTPGLESSVMKFTQFGNMTDQLYPKGPDQRQDDFANQFKRQTQYLTKTSKDIVGKGKRRKRKKKIISNNLI